MKSPKALGVPGSPEKRSLTNCVGTRSYATEDAKLPELKDAEDVTCKDQHPKCPKFKSYGYCNSNPRFMLTHCAGSCGWCDIKCQERQPERCAELAALGYVTMVEQLFTGLEKAAMGSRVGRNVPVCLYFLAHLCSCALADSIAIVRPSPGECALVAL